MKGGDAFDCNMMKQNILVLMQGEMAILVTGVAIFYF